MPARLEIPKGTRFGRLTVVKEIGYRNPRRFLCRCDCGAKKEIPMMTLRNGKSKSCGCLKIEKSTTHGLSGHPLYKVWEGMKSRCYRKNDTFYRFYGGRGITVCDEWRNDAGAFIRWGIDNGYEPGLQLDRRKNHLGYSPKNCRFITQQENLSKQERRIYVQIKGETLTLKEACVRAGVQYHTARHRIMVMGMSPREALRQ